MLSNYLTGLIFALNIASTLAAGVQFAGVNIAGFDFGCTIDVRLGHSLLPCCTWLTINHRAPAHHQVSTHRWEQMAAAMALGK